MKSFVIALLLATPSFAGGIEDRIAAEATRLDAALVKIDESKLPKEMAGSVKAAREHLTDLKKISSPLLRLYRFREPFVEAEALELMSKNPAACNSVDEFVKLWQERRPRFDQKRQAMKGPLLQRALVQSGLNRADKLFRASLPYGKVDFPWSGTYYLAEAEGNLRYASFVDSLTLPAPPSAERRATAAKLRSTLDALEQETLSLFEKDPVSRNSIPVSARLKETRELLDRGWIEGATLTMLESRLGLTRRAGKPAAAQPTTAVTSGQDTLTDLFVTIADEDKEGETARFVRSSVIPLYFSLKSEGGSAVKTSAAPVTVTLVRWPYT